jgi:hypothetical protein
LGSSLEDRLFVITDGRVDALNTFAFQNRFATGSHHQFCLHCRKAYPADEPHPDNDCSQEYLTQFKLEHWDQAKTCENLQTLREQFDAMAMT